MIGYLLVLNVVLSFTNKTIKGWKERKELKEEGETK